MRFSGAALAFLIACGGSSGDDAGDFEHIEVSPPSVMLTVDLGGSAQQAYVVYGVNGSSKQDITSRCGLEIDPEFGAFTGATVTVRPHGGKTSVNATCGALTGTGALAVNLKGRLVVGPNTPPNAPDVFDNAAPSTDAARTPLIEYPLDKAVSPRNIPSIEFQWVANGNDLFHVALRSSFAEVDLYTTDREALMTADHWDSLIGSSAGENLAIVVEGLAQAAPSMKYASATNALVVTHDNIDKTAIYYWASSQGNIMSQTFGDPNPPSLVKDDCTSCHSVSRNGARIGYSRCVANDCGQLFAGFMKFDPAQNGWVETVNANNKAIRGSYTTFAPIGNPAMVGMSTGTLQLYDPDTGAALPSNLAVANFGGTRSALMPDWSPDGNRVVYATSPTPGHWIDLDGGRIAMMSYADQGGTHVFGDPTYLVQNPITLPGGTYQNFFFPSFSPDGNVVVFNAARGAWRNFTNARTAGQRLMLADSAGAWVTDLTAMNGGTGDMDITWAHWAPTVSNEYYWVVFSSERDYGHRTTNATSPGSCKQNGVTQCKQIWLGAVAKNKLGQMMDPSAPPMWLPGQNPLANNISPYWSVPTQLQ
jgi:Tol biopolymer transport system component